jgi:hypothetical protein
MAKTLWNINFSTLNVANEYANGWPSKYTHTNNLNIDGIYQADGQGATPTLSINAVDIDWNGAVLPQSDISNGGSLTINNTGDLLNLVNEIICIKYSPRVVS